MTDRKDDVPAFPGQWYDFQPCTGDQVVREQWAGMTLRDYFAARAMQGLAANPEAWDMTDEMVAKWAYNAADAMIAERSKGE